MIDRLLAFSLRNRLLVALFALGAVGGGVYALSRLTIDAFPDVSQVLFQFITLSPGLAPEEVEKLVT